ncbi:MAG: pyrroloquinoline quinone-dependent dehydrogenase [Opitutus sp.]|nr:pyrroloquinoline quinone-dependent dehydrogenase [Opitutus sp.]
MNRFTSLSCLVLCLGVTGATLSAADHNWAAYLGDAGATHYSTLKRIDPGNVKGLKLAWTYHTGDVDGNNRSQIQCNPLVIDGVLYGTSPQLVAFALDAATGVERWHFTPTDARGGLNRGLTWWTEGNERQLMYAAGRFLYALDPATGQPIEKFGTHGRIDLADEMDRDVTGLYLVSNTPGAIYRDTIIMPVRVGEGPAPAAVGNIRAFDVRTGKRRWIFHTIPHPGEFGHDTWPADAWKTVGGANNWPGLVVDRERGLAFIPTGSASYDFYGADRVGANLFANCLIALDAATGRRKWHFQFVHHDIWDRDPPAPPVLCEVMRDGKKIAAVAQTLKSGHVWVFNRETGESLFPWKEEPVPASKIPGEIAWPTQPLPSKPAPFARQRFTEDEVTTRTPAAHEAVLKRLREVDAAAVYEPPSARGAVLMPGADGGGEWGGPAVDPKGILYVNGSEMAYTFQLVPTAMFTAGPKSLYAQFCLGCHGPKMEGNPSANIPSLVNVGARLKAGDVSTLLRSGKGVMPSFNFLPNETKDALAQFLMAPEAEQAALPRGDTTPITAPPTAYISTGYLRMLDPDGYPAIKPPWGTLNAIDLNTGEYLWRRGFGEEPKPYVPGGRPPGAENYGGPVVTAGGVLFIAATSDEKFRAFSSQSGEMLWETKLPAAGFATPATYEVGGKQYVVIACGGGKQGSRSGDAYVAFALP